MSAGTYNISIEQGSSWELLLDIDSDDVALDITDYSFASKLAKSYYDEDAVSISTSIEDAEEGKFRLFLSPSQTSELDEAYEYIYDIEMTSIGGVVTRLVQGRATIYPGVTS